MRKRWFSGGGLGLRDQVVKALQQARDGDLQAATETISERFPQALGELNRLASPADAAWFRLAAWLAYRSAEMALAAQQAQQAIGLDDDAATWNLLGRIKTWLGENDAMAAFRRAATLSPGHFVIPHRVSHDRFLHLADAALAAIPDAFQERLANTIIVVDDLPALDDVREGEDPDLLGVYEGATVLEHGLPERIVLYQRNHENISASAKDLEHEVADTMRHEIGHHFGLGEDELPY